MLMTPIKPKTIANPNDMISRIELRLTPRKKVSMAFDQTAQVSMRSIAATAAFATVFCDSVASVPSPAATSCFMSGTAF